MAANMVVYSYQPQWKEEASWLRAMYSPVNIVCLTLYLPSLETVVYFKEDAFVSANTGVGRRRPVILPASYLIPQVKRESNRNEAEK